MNKPLFKGMRVLSCALVLVLLIGCVPYFMSRAQTVADLREEKAALEAKIASLESKKNALSGDLSDQKAKKEAIDEQIELKKQQIALNDSMIYELNVQINENQTAISNSEKEIADREDSIKARFAALQERLRVVSKTGNMSLLQMLFDTDNYVDYLLKSKLMKTIAANDEKLIHELEIEIEEINKVKQKLVAKRKDLDSQKESLETVRKEADADKEELEALSNEAEHLMKDLQSDIHYYNNQNNATEDQIAAMEAEIQEILNRSSGSNNEAYLGGKMYWPSRDCFIVTDTFGWRMLSGSSNFHKGIDIACSGSAYGKDIVAADDGIVIYANRYDSWGSGYGYYVMVDHGINGAGQRIVTVYAHMSAVYVSEGQRVTGGSTQLGAIGNTGWSYGSHLHFEVRVDGSPVDPLSCGYVSPP
ncbi:MAG: peptidoglycan DD-metalloendopeptidase family protein [Clostridia bacterium]|nr:peptidoglycan DD-metalloendopeptidase family protein [Clostridia bacterium]